MCGGYDRSRRCGKVGFDVQSRPLWKVLEQGDMRNCYASYMGRMFYDAKLMPMVPIYKVVEVRIR